MTVVDASFSVCFCCHAKQDDAYTKTETSVYFVSIELHLQVHLHFRDMTSLYPLSYQGSIKV